MNLESRAIASPLLHRITASSSSRAMGKLQDKIAVVTGAGRGIGKDIAMRFAGEGAKVAVVSRTEASSQSAADAINAAHPGAAKAYAHGLVGVYRGAGLAASSCILYNHESPLRPQSFVTRKITAAAARISLGLQDRLELGNLHARRDWGWAPDYADAMLRAAAAPDPDDYVIATGESHSIEDFVAAAFTRVGIADWRPLVDLSASLTRVGDAPELVGDASKARRALGWAPTRRFDDIVAAMVDDDLRIASGG